MTSREDRLQELGNELWSLNEVEKDIKGKKDTVRDEILELTKQGFKFHEHMLPVRTIEIPNEFWHHWNGTKEDFVRSRFPGYEITHIESKPDFNVEIIILRRDPGYMSAIIEVSDDDGLIRIRKEISEATPEIDWDTLQSEDPGLFEDISVEVVSREIDEKKLAEKLAENPDLLMKIQRHLKTKTPIVKVTARRIKDGRKSELD